MTGASGPLGRSSVPFADTMRPKFSSTDLLLLAHDEWKRREERKHIHPEPAWVAGFINGFCTDRKWAREYVDKLTKVPPCQCGGDCVVQACFEDCKKWIESLRGEQPPQEP